jgi:hypothetical protein
MITDTRLLCTQIGRCPRQCVTLDPAAEATILLSI